VVDPGDPENGLTRRRHDRRHGESKKMLTTETQRTQRLHREN